MVEADLFKDAAGNKYTLRNSVDCKSSNVVYAVFCERWQAYVHVGETSDTLYQRHLLNLSQIRTCHADPVAAHFYTDGYSVSDFRCH